MVQSQEPSETRPRSSFPESRIAFPRHNQLSSVSLTPLKTFYGWHRILQQLNHAATQLSFACQNHLKITQSHTFAALIRLSTTPHNLLTFNISETSSNNSEKLSLLADKHLCAFSLTLVLFKFPDVQSHGRQTSIDPVFTPEINEVLAQVKVHLEFCSRLINLTPKSLFPKSGQYRSFLSQAGSGGMTRLAK